MRSSNESPVRDDNRTVTEWLAHWSRQRPDATWLRDRSGNTFTEWTWRQAGAEIQAVAAWLESAYGTEPTHCAILSRNRAHWLLADMAIIASGNVSVPLFTTLPASTAEYILDFADVRLLFLGEADNWERVRAVVSPQVQIVSLPGVEIQEPHLRWQDVVKEHAGRTVRHACRHDELASIIFTSGTTGHPKGVMHTHDSMLIPMQRCRRAFHMRQHPRLLSYLPLSHVAERLCIWIQSLLYGGEVTFNESLPHLVRDMAETRPSFFFGAPRVWEMLQQYVVAQFDSQLALDKALEENEEEVGAHVRSMVGLQDADYVLIGAAPAYPTLMHWWERVGLQLMDGYGQTEAMGLIGNRPEEHRIGSIGKPVEGVEARISPSGELLCKADGMALGYFRMPRETGDTFVDGWVHTGDRARVDEDGFYYITGRVKDYFKTIQGKFVSPVPIEAAFSRSDRVEQQCLLGRGYSKTVMVCVLSTSGSQQEIAQLEQDLRAQAVEVNRSVEKHARIGAIIVASEPWTIENGMLTPTLKLRRDQVEVRFGERAKGLARQAAEQGELVLAWESDGTD